MQARTQKFFGPFLQKRTASFLVGLAFCAWAADRLLPPDLSRLAASKEVQAAEGQLLRAFPVAGGIWRLRTTAADVDPRYLQLLLGAEDRRFREHGGVEAGALLRAAWQYARAGRIVSGGSTLSMQVARLLEPHRRSVAGKLHDILRAWQLEERFGKDKILSMYLTLAPFGGNLEGVRAASLTWFGHDAARLSEAEAALLVAIPQSPARRRPDRHFAVAERAAAALVARLRAAGALQDGWSGAAVAASGGAGRPGGVGAQVFRDGAPAGQAAPMRHALPRFAALFCAGLARGAPPGAVIRSTIDFALQRRLEALLSREMAAEPPEVGVAAMIVDNATRIVRASVSGRGPGMAGADLDLTAARRSPGSALKPFIYGMAFDAGVLHPLTLIGDAPGLIPGYAPHNFDDLYHGAITAQTALRQSYNVPAVQVLQAIGPDRFVAGLRQAGAAVAMPGRQASLAVALGGLGISLSDMVMLYAALGDDGRAAPLVRAQGAGAAEGGLHGPARGVLSAARAGGIAAAARNGLCGADRRAGDRLQDRHVLRISRCVGGRHLPRQHHRGMDGTGGGHAPAGQFRPGCGGTADAAGVRPAAARSRCGAAGAGRRHPGGQHGTVANGVAAARRDAGRAAASPGAGIPAARRHDRPDPAGGSGEARGLCGCDLACQWRYGAVPLDHQWAARAGQRRGTAVGAGWSWGDVADRDRCRRPCRARQLSDGG